MNLKIYQILWYLGYRYEMVELVIQQPQNNNNALENDDFTTFSQRIKKCTQEMLNKL